MREPGTWDKREVEAPTSFAFYSDNLLTAESGKPIGMIYCLNYEV